MKNILLCLLLSSLLIACNKKSMPTMVDRSKDPPPPPSPVANVKADLAIGKNVFTTRCARCHALPDPAKYSEAGWDRILRTMVPRAGVDRVQEVHLTAYLKANASRK